MAVSTDKIFDELTVFLQQRYPSADTGDLTIEDYKRLWDDCIWTREQDTCFENLRSEHSPDGLILMTASLTGSDIGLKQLKTTLWRCLYAIRSRQLFSSSYAFYQDAAITRWVTAKRSRLYSGVIFVYGDYYEEAIGYRRYELAPREMYARLEKAGILS